jgi:hypothetical protein
MSIVSMISEPCTGVNGAWYTHSIGMMLMLLQETKTLVASGNLLALQDDIQWCCRVYRMATNLSLMALLDMI